MTDQPIFKEADEKSPLGPHYYSAQRFSETLISSEDWELLKKPMDDLALKFYEKVQDLFENSLHDDFESNLQTHIWRTVDEVVQAILGKKQWPSDRYLLGDRYDCEAIRAVIAKQCGDEVAKLHILDLKNEVARLKKDVELYRRHA